MSRGFVKESDQEEVPIVPPRAELPVGTINYVTQAGMNDLLMEKQGLIEQKSSLSHTSESEQRIASNHLDALLLQLETRIASARIVDLTQQPEDEVRFGATVTLRIEGQKKPKQFQIVGVDEASIAKGKISFISPIAQAITGKKAGEKVILKLPAGEKAYEILEIKYVP